MILNGIIILFFHPYSDHAVTAKINGEESCLCEAMTMPKISKRLGQTMAPLRCNRVDERSIYRFCMIAVAVSFRTVPTWTDEANAILTVQKPSQEAKLWPDRSVRV